MPLRSSTTRQSVLDRQERKFCAKASDYAAELQVGIPSVFLSGLNAYLLEYVDYSISIGNENYAAMDGALDFVITNNNI